MKNKTLMSSKSKCINCIEERKKADRSRKYAHELKNIFITISTVVNSEIETVPHQSFSSFSNNTNYAVESGDVSPFIMEGRKNRSHSKANISSIFNNNDSPFYFLKTLCDYGKTLIKEINEMGKDYNTNGNKLEPFNISKAIDFCVDMFDTKRKYDKSKKNLEIFSDINFSYDKMIKSISETGFKMVLINLLTNSYKFTVKGKIIVRAVSIPKEKKIRILVKDSGKGFNMNEFKKNGCFYVYEKNQDLNADGSGLGLTIVSEILTKFNIKLDCLSNTEKGGSLFYFDLDDSYPYYDEINPNELMTSNLTKILNDINSDKNDQDITINEKDSFNLRENIVKINSKKKKNENEKNVQSRTNNNINNNNLRINFNSNNKARFSFMMLANDVNCSPTFGSKKFDKKSSKRPSKVSLEKSSKNLNINNNSTNSNSNNNLLENNNNNNNKSRKSNEFSVITNIITNNISNSYVGSPNKKKIGRFFSLQRQKSVNKDSTNIIKKEEKNNFLKQVMKDKNFNKLKTFDIRENKEDEISLFKLKFLMKKNFEDFYNIMIEREEDQDEIDFEYNKIQKAKKAQKNKKNYKKLLDKNFNKTKFYLLDLKNIFKKNEIYIHLHQQIYKKCLTEASSENNSPRKLRPKKSFYANKNKVYIIICDDEEFVARSARELIINYYIKKGREPHVYYTPNGIECLYLMYKLAFIENRKIEYILMDLEMPYLNGIRTCNIIKSIKEINIPVFILSGDEPRDCEANGYCNKPLNEVDIINKLDI